MADKIFDRVQETTTTTGTGPIILGGASPGFRTFGSVYANNDVLHYCYVDPVTNAWEVARGVYVSGNNSISRVTLEASSTGSFLSLAGSAGAYVFVNFSAAQLSAVVIPVTTANSGSAVSLVFPQTGCTAYDITLTANCTFSISGGTAGQMQEVMLVVRGGAGGFTASLPTGIKWSGGNPPIIDTSAGSYNEFYIRTVDGGATYSGSF